MNSTQFAWAYLLKNGVVGVTYGYYGGYELIGDRNSCCVEHEKIQKLKNSAIAKIREFGVDWKKTRPPESDWRNEFDGTFNDPKSVEFISGVLVLKNGESQKWIADRIEVTEVFDLMADAENAKEFSFLE